MHSREHIVVCSLCVLVVSVLLLCGQLCTQSRTAPKYIFKQKIKMLLQPRARSNVSHYTPCAHTHRPHLVAGHTPPWSHAHLSTSVMLWLQRSALPELLICRTQCFINAFIFALSHSFEPPML